MKARKSKELWNIVLIIFVCTVIVLASVFVIYTGIDNFIRVQKTTYEMASTRVIVNEYEEPTDRYSPFYLTSEEGLIYNVFNDYHFDVISFREKFVPQKEYTIVVKAPEVKENPDYVYVYGLSDENTVYLHTKEAIAREKFSAVFLFVFALILIAGYLVLAIVFFWLIRKPGKKDIKIMKV